jgi:hypothetical protein
LIDSEAEEIDDPTSELEEEDEDGFELNNSDDDDDERQSSKKASKSKTVAGKKKLITKRESPMNSDVEMIIDEPSVPNTKPAAVQQNSNVPKRRQLPLSFSSQNVPTATKAGKVKALVKDWDD